MLLLKPVYFYTLGYLITYLIIRYKVYIGEYQRKIKEEFSIIDIKANHYVFIHGKQIIGIVRIMYEKGIADLARVTVIKEYRNQGYGRELMKRVINEVRNSRKAEIIRLSISDKAMLDFYQQFGFKENGEVYFHNIPSISMIKVL
ncbi:MAG: GNAT family N-acetyltransferase [Rickettsiaceae bacterium]|nr:GNAT family N-acetyltransferase [Rickettsiaceae bacterium]